MPERRWDPSTIRLASCSSATADDALPGRRRVDRKALRSESRPLGQRGSVRGSLLRGLLHLGGVLGVEVLLVDRYESDVGRLPDAENQRVAPRRELPPASSIASWASSEPS